MFLYKKKSFRKETLHNLIYLLIVIITKLLLEAVYIKYINPLYEYMGLIYNPSEYRLIESYVILVILYFLTPVGRYSIVDLFLNLQYLITIIPILSFYWLTSQSRIFLYGVVLCHVMQCLVSRVSNNKTVNFPYKLQVNTIYKGLLLLSALLLLYCIYRYGIPSLSGLNFNNVYIIRKKNTWTFPLSYLVPWYAKIIFPFGMILSVKNKKYLVSGLLLACFIGIYLLFPNKAFLFSVVLILGVYFGAKLRKLYFFLYGMLPLVLISGVLEKSFFNSRIIISYLVRRALIIPAQLKFAYFDFFSVNEKYYFAKGRIGKLFGIDTDYTDTIPVVIGKYTGISGHANTGYLGESYAQAGFTGLFLLALILILFLKLIDVKSRKISIEVAVSVTAFWLYSLNDSALLTALLTGGGLLFLLLFSLFKESGDRNRKT